MTAADALVRLIAILIVAAALPAPAEDAIIGRWEGGARMPDDELNVIVDLAQQNGVWVGSIIIPGLGVKGTLLTDIKVQAPDVNFAVKGPLGIQLAVAGDVVFIGVMNGTLEARDAKTGDLLWDFRVEKSKRNNSWVLTGDRKFNVPFLYHSNWREAPLVATDQQIRIGGIYSSSLVVNGVVYFGSADGFLYALE